jgi:hypothetical protein
MPPIPAPPRFHRARSLTVQILLLLLGLAIMVTAVVVVWKAANAENNGLARSVDSLVLPPTTSIPDKAPNGNDLTPAEKLRRENARLQAEIEALKAKAAAEKNPPKK